MEGSFSAYAYKKRDLTSYFNFNFPGPYSDSYFDIRYSRFPIHHLFTIH